MASSIVVSASWREGIRSALGQVTSSGQAAAAIQEAVDFAGQAIDIVSGSIVDWLFGSDAFGDPWRSAAEKQLADAQRQVQLLGEVYAEDSSLPVGHDWPTHRAAVQDLYNLAQVIRQGYPEDADGSGFDTLMTNSLGSLPAQIAAAPKAVVSAVVSVASDVADGAATIVRKAGGVLKEAASAVKDTAESLVPWKIVLGGALLVGGLIVGVAYLSKSGVKVKVPL